MALLALSLGVARADPHATAEPGSSAIVFTCDTVDPGLNCSASVDGAGVGDFPGDGAGHSFPASPGVHTWEVYLYAYGDVVGYDSGSVEVSGAPPTAPGPDDIPVVDFGAVSSQFYDQAAPMVGYLFGALMFGAVVAFGFRMLRRGSQGA